TGGNFRLDALQAALLRVQLPRLDAAIARRREIAATYGAHFKDLGLGGKVDPLASDRGSTFNQFVAKVQGREGARHRMRRRLTERGIGTEIYYPAPLNRQPCFRRDPVHEQRFPVAEAAANVTLALPIFPELTAAEIEAVAGALADAARAESGA